MGIIPEQYTKDVFRRRGSLHGNSDKEQKPMNGWLALSPLILFLAIYLASSLIAGDFYKIPTSAAFLIASCYAVAITRGVSVEDKIEKFSKGAGDRNVLLMIWIFILAGAFAGTAKDIGAIEETVKLTLKILPGNLLYGGLFLASCFISMAIGTSVGTIVAMVPVATGIAVETGSPIPFMAAVITGGAFFGDNLSFISDTTIAATKTQGCNMRDKFKANLAIAAPAAIAVTVLYIIKGHGIEASPESAPVEWIKLLPYIFVIGMAISGVSVASVLAAGIGINAIIGFCCGNFTWTGWLGSLGQGISGMGDLIIVTMLAGGMLETIRHNGGIDFIINGLTSHIKGTKGAQLCIAAIVSLANACTANNTIAIITTGGIARDITKKFGLDPRKTASILDTFSCFVQGILPYGAQLLMASALSGTSPASIIAHLYYPFALGALALLSIIIGFPRSARQK